MLIDSLVDIFYDCLYYILKPVLFCLITVSTIDVQHCQVMMQDVYENSLYYYGIDYILKALKRDQYNCDTLATSFVYCHSLPFLIYITLPRSGLLLDYKNALILNFFYFIISNG